MQHSQNLAGQFPHWSVLIVVTAADAAVHTVGVTARLWRADRFHTVDHALAVQDPHLPASGKSLVTFLGVCFLPVLLSSSHSCNCSTRGDQEAIFCPKFLAYAVILWFEKRNPKQNAVARPKSNILAGRLQFPPQFWAGYAINYASVCTAFPPQNFTVAEFERRLCDRQTTFNHNYVEFCCWLRASQWIAKSNWSAINLFAPTATAKRIAFNFLNLPLLCNAIGYIVFRFRALNSGIRLCPTHLTNRHSRAVVLNGDAQSTTTLTNDNHIQYKGHPSLYLQE